MSDPLPLALADSVSAADWRATVHWLGTDVPFSAEDFVAQPRFEVGFTLQWQRGIATAPVGALQLTLREESQASEAFIAAAEAAPHVVPLIRLRMQGPEGVVQFEGSLAEWTLHEGALRIRAHCRWPWHEGRTLCRDAATLDEGIAAGLLPGTWLPRTFGEHDGVEAVPFFPVRSVRLAEDVSPESTEILLASDPGWPSSGRVQAGDEVFEYGSIESAPLRLATLDRPEAKQHPRGRVLFLLPDDSVPLHWIAADHPAEILAIRAGSSDGLPAEGVTDEATALSGTQATRLSSPRLPVEAHHAAWTVEWNVPPDADDWTIGTLTTALFPELAFDAGGDSPGARLSPTEDRLRATWETALSTGSRRFDRIARARLAFEWSSSGNWAVDSRIKVTIFRGSESVVAFLGESVPDQIRTDVEGTALLPENVERVAPGIGELDRLIDLRFDRVDGASVPDWSDAPDAIGGTFDRFAEWEETGGTVTKEPLRLRLDVDRTGTERGLRDLGLFTRIRAVPAQDIRLHLELPGHIDAVSTFEADGDWKTLGEMLDVSGATMDDLLDSSAVFVIEPTEPGLVQVAGAWLRARLLPAKVEVEDVDPPDEAPLDIEARSSAPFLPFEVDVTSLLGDPAEWAAFDPGDPALIMQIELVAPSPSLEVRLRRLRWTFDLFPATRVGATPRLFTHQRGLLTESDGACAPEDVLEALLGDERFGALDAQRFLLDESLASWNDDGNRRFRALFLDGTTLDAAFAAAVVEAGAVLVFRDGKWCACSLEDALWEATPRLLAASDALEFPAAARFAPAALRAGRLLFVVHADGTGIAETLSTGAPGTERWRLRWAESGTESLAALAGALFGERPEGEVQLPVRGGPDDWQAGAVVALALEPHGSEWTRALATRTSWTGKETEAVLRRLE